MEFGFYLKKFVTFFFEPLGFVLALFAIGLYFLFVDRKNLSKLFLSLSFLFLLLFSYEPFSNFLVKNLEESYPKYGYNKDIKYIHVLGNGHNTDESQPLSSNISSSGIKRVLEGVIIHMQTPGSKLVFTGYEGDTEIPNAIMNAKLAAALGVEEKNMILNPNPKDTKEEALFLRSILGGEKFVLVTSATHMPRAIMLFESLGLNPVAAPTDFHKKEHSGYLKAPDIDALEDSKMAIHEYLGILWSFLKK
ncbi:MAG: ElyC/SanA/YdcF family protein [Sulfurimonas sp.]|uniref:ElyC/SanA/YdcF family protein n=1 Tax=Sulfurimonas sp. TaxID=2022749 RepID=UPI0028CD66B1|nr:ElyC/SanA/YdcF family protein [Sulfurimonas sp.]MDT8337931.1 ElyC/SanA/YdcF family protein [Sulfurimonas sp.]